MRILVSRPMTLSSYSESVEVQFCHLREAPLIVNILWRRRRDDLSARARREGGAARASTLSDCDPEREKRRPQNFSLTDNS